MLIKNNATIQVYHNPREVIVHPKAKTVEIFNTDGTLLQKYALVEKDLQWLDSFSNDTSEILLKLVVQ
jgi:hypothetical protein